MIAGIKKAANNAHLFFIPPKYRTDDVVFRKCKIFINTTLVTSLFAIFFLGNAVLFHMPMATDAMIVCCILFFSFAWMMKFGVPAVVCTNCYIALGVAATAWDAFYAGGLHSIHTPWFVFPAIGAILIGTVRQGIIWLCITVAVVLGFGVAALSGYQFPQELGPKYIDAMALSAIVGLIIILFLVVLVVENAYLRSLEKLENALESLHKSQDQLIHQEKLASLGQLIAGIAHEIQNPLNFVNNFSSVSKEILDELKDAKTEEERQHIMQLLDENLARIEQHGKRADSIVKDMLMHARVQPGERHAVDINRLCEEAAVIAWQSAKVNLPECEVEVDKNYASGLPQPVVISQDISRVLLNLLNNAFYSVNQKRKRKEILKESYHPSISLVTRTGDDEIVISVKDNGVGIAPHIIDQIFQPFFTTKPAREGTGLGLSISYDIIKAHGGTIKVESLELVDATFTVTLPVKAVFANGGVVKKA